MGSAANAPANAPRGRCTMCRRRAGDASMGLGVSAYGSGDLVYRIDQPPTPFPPPGLRTLSRAQFTAPFTTLARGKLSLAGKNTPNGNVDSARERAAVEWIWHERGAGCVLLSSYHQFCGCCTLSSFHHVCGCCRLEHPQKQMLHSPTVPVSSLGLESSAMFASE